jgi:hypothetical protein
MIRLPEAALGVFTCMQVNTHVLVQFFLYIILFALSPIGPPSQAIIQPNDAGKDATEYSSCVFSILWLRTDRPTRSTSRSNQMPGAASRDSGRYATSSLRHCGHGSWRRKRRAGGALEASRRQATKTATPTHPSATDR